MKLVMSKDNKKQINVEAITILDSKQKERTVLIVFDFSSHR